MSCGSAKLNTECTDLTADELACTEGLISRLPLWVGVDWHPAWNLHSTRPLQKAFNHGCVWVNQPWSTAHCIFLYQKSKGRDQPPNWYYFTHGQSSKVLLERKDPWRKESQLVDEIRIRWTGIALHTGVKLEIPEGRKLPCGRDKDQMNWCYFTRGQSSTAS